MENHAKRQKEDLPLDKPNRDSNVWPRQRCPAFTPRSGAVLNECWYCIYADFHLDKPKSLEVGVCYYPEKQMKQEEITK